MDRCDVLVIGGGIAGLSVAWRLAGKASVTLVEMEQSLAHHSSGRSAAMLNVTSGPAEVCSLAASSREFLLHPPDELGVPSLLSPRGLLWVGVDGTSSMLDELVAKSPGASTRITPKDVSAHASDLIESACAAGAVFEPEAMEIDVPGFIASLRTAAVARGVRIIPGAEAITLHRNASAWHVTTGRLRIAAQQVVNAAGAWGDEIARRAQVRPLGLVALRRTAVVLDVEQSIRHWPMVMDVGGQWYLAPMGDGVMISAADETESAPIDASPLDRDVNLALERIHNAFRIDVRRVRRSWAGLRTFTPDRLPAVGPDPDEPSFVWLVGQGGAGVKTAPELSRIAADAVLGSNAVPAALDITRLRA